MQQSSMKKPLAISTLKMSSKISDKSKQLVPKQLFQKQQRSPGKEIMTPYQLASPKKKSNIFITQKKVSEVQATHAQLNSYIDILDEKVTKLIEKHEAQFLVAYRNHIKKVREQMQQIRSKALNNASSTVSQTQKIQALEKQLTIFRQESLKLFEKVNEKQRNIYALQSKISELESQRNHFQKSLRILTKRNKQLEGIKYDEMQQQKFGSQSKKDNKQFQILRPYAQEQIPENNINQKADIGYLGIFGKTRPYTTAINSKGISNRSRNHSIQINNPPSQANIVHVDIEQINSKIDEIIGNQISPLTILNLKQSLSEILKGQTGKIQKLNQQPFRRTIESRPNNMKSLLSKASRSFYESKMQSKKSEMEDLFYTSVETVKKQITRRKGIKNLNFYNDYTKLSFQEFKKVDFFRLLQIILTNQRILAVVHQTIFQQSKYKN